MRNRCSPNYRYSRTSETRNVNLKYFLHVGFPRWWEQYCKVKCLFFQKRLLFYFYLFSAYYFIFIIFRSAAISLVPASVSLSAEFRASAASKLASLIQICLEIQVGSCYLSFDFVLNIINQQNLSFFGWVLSPGISRDIYHGTFYFRAIFE